MIAMPRRTATAFVAVLLLTLLFAAGCGQVPEDSGDSGEMEIRTYTVPEGRDATTLRDNLWSSLNVNDQALGSIVAYPDGRLVVTAPASVHAGVEALIEQMATAGPGTIAQPRTVAIDYWIVVGRPRGNAAGAQAPQWEDRSLIALAPALAQIQAAQVPMTFRLLEKLRLTSASSGGARMNGRFTQVEQRVSSLQSGNSFADIEIDIPRHAIATRVKLEPGKLVVLGETGLKAREFPLLEASDDENLMLYYIISADID